MALWVMESLENQRWLSRASNPTRNLDSCCIFCPGVPGRLKLIQEPDERHGRLLHPQRCSNQVKIFRRADVCHPKPRLWSIDQADPVPHQPSTRLDQSEPRPCDHQGRLERSARISPHLRCLSPLNSSLESGDTDSGSSSLHPGAEVSHGAAVHCIMTSCCLLPPHADTQHGAGKRT